MARNPGQARARALSRREEASGRVLLKADPVRSARRRAALVQQPARQKKAGGVANLRMAHRCKTCRDSSRHTTRAGLAVGGSARMTSSKRRAPRSPNRFGGVEASINLLLWGQKRENRSFESDWRNSSSGSWRPAVKGAPRGFAANEETTSASSTLRFRPSPGGAGLQRRCGGGILCRTAPLRSGRVRVEGRLQSATDRTPKAVRFYFGEWAARVRRP